MGTTEGPIRRGHRAPLALAMAAVSAVAALGLNLPAAVPAATGAAPTAPRPSPSVCFFFEEHHWICSGTFPYDPPSAPL
jgi:hypothetical protein